MHTLVFPFPKDALCQVWMKVDHGSGEEDDNVKSVHTDGQAMDDGRSE